MKVVTLSLLLAFAALSGCRSQATSTGSDPLSGRWDGTWGPSEERQTHVVLELKWDGAKLTGVVNPDSRAMDISTASFNANTSAVKMELDAIDLNGEMDHYSIQGKVDGKNMSGTWTRKNGAGTFKISRN